MDYKKKYEQAIERAKKFYNRELYAECNGSLVEFIFPELKESEDERIRKALLESFEYQIKESYPDKEWHCGIKLKEVLAWLEKQDPKKHEEELEGAYKCADEVQYRKGYEDAKKEFEKQGEQKKEIKYIYPKFRVGDVIEPVKPNGYYAPVRVKYIGEGNYSCESDDCKSFLSLPICDEDEYVLTTWSEEDEEHVSSLLQRLKGLCSKKFATTRFAINEDEEWLKSLKERMKGEQNGCN